jgi:hypothetical protein
MSRFSRDFPRGRYELCAFASAGFVSLCGEEFPQPVVVSAMCEFVNCRHRPERSTYVPLSSATPCRILTEAMGNRTRRSGWQTPSRRTPALAQRVRLLPVVAFALLLTPLRLTSQTVNEPNSTEVITYFRTQAPPSQGAAVCRSGGGETIGNINSIRLMPHHDEYHDAWEAVMEINKRDAHAVTADSTAEAHFSENCGITIDVIGAGPSIAYHTVLRGEVNYFAEIGYMIPPKPWWQPAMDYLAMDVGIIWVEVVGAPILIVGATTIFISRALGKRTKRRN